MARTRKSRTQNTNAKGVLPDDLYDYACAPARRVGRPAPEDTTAWPVTDDWPEGRTVPMEKLDTLVADHIEHRLLQPGRLEKILSSVLDRPEERTERQTTHIAKLRKRATEADAKLKRLYDAIENGVTDLSDLMLKDRIAELKAIRDQARADAERAEGAIDRLGPTITTRSIKAFARTARKRMRIEGGGYRCDYLRALAQRVEVDAQELRIMGSKSELLRTLVAASSAKTAGFWRAQFYTEVARLLTLRFVVWCRCGVCADRRVLLES